MKKLLSILLALSLILCSFGVCFAATVDKKMWTDTYLVMDLQTGELLASENEKEKRFPASTTKMVTALVVMDAVEKGQLKLSDVLETDEDTAATEGSKFGLKAGETITVEDALNIMLVLSANDIAMLLSKAVAGTVDAFVLQMNQKAEALGCTDTHFTSPHGLHDEDHYTTAWDLSVIARELVKNEYLASVVSQSEYNYAATNKRDAGSVKTSNLLMNGDLSIYVGNERRTTKYEGAEVIGIKTGTTPEAGGCLVAAAKKDGTTILTIVLKSGTGTALERYADTQQLLDWAFAHYRTVDYLEKNVSVGTVKVKHGVFNKVNAVVSQDVYVTLPTEASESVLTQAVELDKAVKAPFEAGTELGKVHVYKAGEEIAAYPVVAEKAVEKGGILSVFGIEDATAAKIFKTIKTVLLVLLVLFAALMVLRAYNKRKARLRKAAKARRKAELERQRREAWEQEYEKRYDYDSYPEFNDPNDPQ